MPELPEVETVRRGLNRVTPQRHIRGVEVLRPSAIAHPPSPGAFCQQLSGWAIVEWHRRGKYLLAALARDSAASWLVVHLRMTGQLLWLHQDDALQTHTRVRLLFGDRRELRFVDTRTFGQMWWVPPETPPPAIATGLQKLGPEPLSEDFSTDYAVGWLQGRRRPIKSALLDQGFVAGIGNIYADESLFLARIHPQTLCCALPRSAVATLRDRIVEVLQTAIAAGGTTFSNFMDVQGINGNYGGNAWVYKRAGEPCRVCSTPVERLVLAGRSSCFCPRCQTQPDARIARKC